MEREVLKFQNAPDASGRFCGEVTQADFPSVDALRDLIAGVVPAAGHAGLRDALAARYPSLEWRVADYVETWFRPGRQVIDPAGNLIAADRKMWLRGLLDAVGGDFVQVWQEHRGSGFATVEEQGHTVFVAAAIGPRPEDAIETKVDWIVDGRAEPVFISERPQDASALLDPFSHEEVDWRPTVQPRYQLHRMDAVAATLMEAEALDYARRVAVAQTRKVWVTEVCMDSRDRDPAPRQMPILELDPAYLRRPIRERRFVDDWFDSSAGATSFLHHWAFDVGSHEDEGGRHLRIMPRPLTWADEIKPGRDMSLFMLMDQLERFDSEIGHPMAWFFHALYGNRLGFWAIQEVAEGLRRRKIGLPKRDKAVIERWMANEYGF